MNIALLIRLRDAGGAHVPWPCLRREFRAIEADLEALESFGYAIERHPYLGVAYRGPAKRLSPDQIEWELRTRRIGRRIAVWNRVTSTNDLAIRAASSRANEGLVILAEEQSCGRGRRGRSWHAPRGGCLLMSALVFPPETLGRPGWLTALGAVAVAEVAEALTGRQARIKWPNDVLIEGRKIAGVLVERAAGSVIGIGVNVNMCRTDFPESLRDSSDSLNPNEAIPLDRSEVARALIRRLDDLYEEGYTSGPAPLNESWKARLDWLGLPVRLETTEGSVRGVLSGASLFDGLRIKLPGGAERLVPGSEVVSLGREGLEPLGPFPPD